MLCSSGVSYDVIIVDTAPTGHTLRLLSLPKFLDGFLSKLLVLRKKLLSLAATFQAFIGSSEETANQQQQILDETLEKFEIFRNKMSIVQNKLKDSSATSFLLVTIPTKLSVSESKRLFDELSKQSIRVSDIVVNQCLIYDDENMNILENYYERRKTNQNKYIKEMLMTIEKISSTPEYQSNHGNLEQSSSSIQMSIVNYCNVELVGIAALAYLGNTFIQNNYKWDYLLKDGGEKKFVICGGKGGVGKTTTSSALAVAMANSGRKVALISTDPAHSLGDALDIDLSNGSLVDLSSFLRNEEGTLKAMEVNPELAVSKFKQLVDNLIGTKVEEGEVGKSLRDLTQVFDTLPAGADEVIALSQIVSILNKDDTFDRIVLDTAPTGHTLRMLTTPSFLAELIDRVLVISQKINSNSLLNFVLTNDQKGSAEKAKSTLLSFQMQMYDLEDLFCDAAQTEFLVVTIPTELAVRESIRLVNDLTFEAPDMPIKVRNVVMNQVLPEDDVNFKEFSSQIRNGQTSSITLLQNGIQNTEITKAPYLDTEPRGIFGLKALATQLFVDNTD